MPIVHIVYLFTLACHWHTKISGPYFGNLFVFLFFFLYILFYFFMNIYKKLLGVYKQYLWPQNHAVHIFILLAIFPPISFHQGVKSLRKYGGRRASRLAKCTEVESSTITSGSCDVMSGPMFLIIGTHTPLTAHFPLCIFTGWFCWCPYRHL